MVFLCYWCGRGIDRYWPPTKVLEWFKEKAPKGRKWVVRADNKEYQSFIAGNANLYYSGRKFPSTFNILSFKFFAPYYDGGIREYYEIIGIRSALKSEIEKHDDESNDGVRFFFELGKCIKIADQLIKVVLIQDTYGVISLENLNK